MVEDIQIGSNGHNPEVDGMVADEISQDIKGGHGTLDKDRNIITMENRQYASVLQQSMNSSIKKNTELLSELKTANWDSEEQRMDWLNAYDECVFWGADTSWLERMLVARNAGINSARLSSIFEAISHTTYNVNSNNGFTQRRNALSFLRRGNGNGKESPLT